MIRILILAVLIIPLIISLGYLLTHPMPSHNLAAFEAMFNGVRAAGGQDQTRPKQKVADPPKQAPHAGDPNIPEGNHIRIKTADGSFLIELFSADAPDTVANFKLLAAGGFYDGLAFHRVVSGFMAQGGNPESKGTGGLDYRIPAEFNDHRHITGTVGMMRATEAYSSGSQFYICYGAHPALDGKYTVFGQVIEGQDVVNRIKKGTIMSSVKVLP